MMFGEELDLAMMDQLLQLDEPVVSPKATNTGRRKRSKSKVWEEFTPVLRAGKVQSARCNHCEKQLGGKSTAGISHLRRHLKICSVRAIVEGGCQNGPSSQPSSSASKTCSFDQEKSLEVLTRAVISNSNSCSSPIIGSATFRNFLTGINPMFNMVPQAITEERILGIFQREQLELKEKIALLHGGVFFSLADWEHGFEQNFLCLRVQFIDEDWVMNRIIIRCVCSNIGEYFLDSYLSMLPDWNSFRKLNTDLWKYDGKPVKAVIIETIDGWSLGQKLLGLTSQHARDSKVTMELEENISSQNYLVAKHKLLSIPCMVTALNNLFGWELKDFVLETSASCFRCMTYTPARKKKYEEILSKIRLSRPSFGSQRWYLTFYSLEVALQFFKAYPNIEELDPVLWPNLKPSSEQLEAAESFCKTAWPIYHAIKVISSPHHLTFNSYYDAILSVRTALRVSSKMVNVEHVLDIEDMQKKFEENWREWYLWLSLAVVLDPRYKISFVELRSRQTFGHDADMYISEVRAKMYDLFIRYSSHVNEPTIDVLNQTISDLRLDWTGSESFNDASQSYINPEGHDEFKELNEYLGAELSPQNNFFDIMKWWKNNTSTYPTLARVARDILAIPGYAVSADSAFDKDDKRVSFLNTKASPEVVEAFICMNDLIKFSEASHPNDHGSNWQ
ncbi:zinc finger BED domain-containing protein RICESLEEPER 1-like [Triticum dicoccoides]|uniref:zinc finger BED domain-containing protein RICESLEEPER 1-like n=1 Tax=Triticum dicoccoides TaxID=85692 RepID=UPI000E7C82E9|nr:zinc finger BED domain-containing protein RICESLEEPER 1-like [Triticum dicoccoides]